MKGVLEMCGRISPREFENKEGRKKKGAIITIIIKGQRLLPVTINSLCNGYSPLTTPFTFEKQPC